MGGVLLLFGQALVRLTPIAWEALTSGTLTSMEWAIYVGWVVVSAYTEGYRAFQKGFAPRVVTRAFELATAPRGMLFAGWLPSVRLISLQERAVRGGRQPRHPRDVLSQIDCDLLWFRS